MNKLFGLLIALALSFQAYAQTQRNDFVVSKKNIIVLTEEGDLKLFDKKKLINTDSIDTPSKAVLLTKNRLGEIVIVDEDNSVKRYLKKKKSWEQIAKANNEIFGVLFDSENTCFIITEEGIENTKSRKTYFSDEGQNHQIHFYSKWQKPYTCYIDNNDRIWLGYAFGEWGGEIYILDTKKREFLTPNYGEVRIELLQVISFFETNENLFFSSGLQHFDTQGTIVKFDNLDATEFYDSPAGFRYESNPGEYIGPATFNKYNNSIYYYSDRGVKKGKLYNDLSKKENWELVIKPVLHWKTGHPDAVGSPMNVLKLEILDENRFVILSQNDGILLFDGKELIELK